VTIEAQGSRTGGALIIDDVPFIRKLLLQHLWRAGWRPVVEAASGREALACLKGNRFDLILLDVALPDVDGIDLLPAIKRLQPKATVLVVTAAASSPVVRRAKVAGAYSVLVKPVDSEYLGSLLRELREGRKDG